MRYGVVFYVPTEDRGPGLTESRTGWRMYVHKDQPHERSYTACKYPHGYKYSVHQWARDLAKQNGLQFIFMPKTRRAICALTEAATAQAEKRNNGRWSA